MSLIPEAPVVSPSRETAQSLSRLAYETIKHKIVSLQLPPGSVIDEAALREELDMGRTPIREALQRLAQEKLVTIIPRRGTFVSEIGITDLQRLFEARLVLEPFVVQLAAKRGRPEHWAEMARMLSEMEGRLGDNEALIALDAACHEIIYEAADNKFLRDSLVALYALSLRLWYYSLSQLGNMEEAVLEHRGILKALQKGDGARAALLMEEHIRTFQEEIQAAMVGR
ncbi:MAG: GntR family transcriptional regulator [Chloroflexi bacterium]|nr:GntR family transcriptional regulator [Chloroflexota bacterium]